MSETASGPVSNERGQRARGSALWAAAGDAVGWITELGDQGTIKARTGTTRIDRPVDWVRRIGGLGGVKVKLPAGTYSDDTQLRLAVCRSIRGNGTFDAEAFARVELTVWQGYSLGAGRGTRAAAANFTKRGVNWFSNFFDNKLQKYVNAGGNGAAMRVQPHAWLGRQHDELILSVMRDALTTHGHPHGFVGAVYHAVFVSVAMNGSLLDPLDSGDVIESIRSIPRILEGDRQLSAFWKPAWEDMSGHSLESALERTVDELRTDIEMIRPELTAEQPQGYGVILEKLQLRSEQFRGSGLKTALAASALTWLYRKATPGAALIAAANELNSDTDTIATMAGAILGAMQASEPEWAVQDREYIKKEADRIAAITPKAPQDSFTYPDLLKWRPPIGQSGSVIDVDGIAAIAGLGTVSEVGEEYRNGDAIWQWMTLPFGQTVLAKRKADTPTAGSDQLPRERRVAKPDLTRGTPPLPQPELNFDSQSRTEARDEQSAKVVERRARLTIDEITDQIERSNFDPYLIGRAFNHMLERRGVIEDVVMLASIIAKAKLNRIKKRPN